MMQMAKKHQISNIAVLMAHMCRCRLNSFQKLLLSICLLYDLSLVMMFHRLIAAVINALLPHFQVGVGEFGLMPMTKMAPTFWHCCFRRCTIHSLAYA